MKIKKKTEVINFRTTKDFKDLISKSAAEHKMDNTEFIEFAIKEIVKK